MEAKDEKDKRGLKAGCEECEQLEKEFTAAREARPEREKSRGEI